jgi:hypothetical protein
MKTRFVARASLGRCEPARTTTEEAVYEAVVRQAAHVDSLSPFRGGGWWREEQEDASDAELFSCSMWCTRRSECLMS